MMRLNSLKYSLSDSGNLPSLSRRVRPMMSISELLSSSPSSPFPSNVNLGCDLLMISWFLFNTLTRSGSTLNGSDDGVSLYKLLLVSCLSAESDEIMVRVVWS